MIKRDLFISERVLPGWTGYIFFAAFMYTGLLVAIGMVAADYGILPDLPMFAGVIAIMASATLWFAHVKKYALFKSLSIGFGSALCFLSIEKVDGEGVSGLFGLILLAIGFWCVLRNYSEGPNTGI